MGILGEKKPVLSDLDMGLVATFIKFEDEGAEDGWTFPVYTPFNSFRQIRYPHPVAKDSIHDVHPGNTKVAGVEERIIYIFSGKKGSLSDFMENKSIKKINILKQELKDKEVEIMTLQQDLDDALSGVSKQIQKQKSIGRTPTPGTGVTKKTDSTSKFYEDL